jgi:Ca2+-binding EF-hand superfamily protein
MAAAPKPSLDEAPQTPGRTHERFSFEELDVNRDGVIARTEAAFKPQLAENFDYADKNGNGTLNRPEVEAALAMSAEMFGEGERSREKRDIFRSLDMDGNAVVSRTEAKWRPPLARNFERIDRNGDGHLDMGEFAEISLADLSSK